jgi:Cu(I)/Ag(I) efflux system membrane fusion protein
MKTWHLVSLILVAGLAGTGGWFLARHQSTASPNGATANDPQIIYTCSMHPQVRQNHPGTCPFCGMALAPLNALPATGLSAGSVMLSSNRINALNVETVVVRRQQLKRTLQVAGIIDDNDVRHRFLSSYVDGRVDKLFINYVGAEVQAGQPLALLYSPTLLTAEREYTSLARLVPPSESPSGRFDQPGLLAGARQRLIQLGLSEAQIAALTNKPSASIHTEITAPSSGTVVNRFVYEGAYVKEGEKLFELADFSTMWFRFDAYERDLVWLQPGQAVDVTTPAAPGRVFTAPIVFIDPNVNDPTRSAKVRVELANPLIATNGQTRRELLHRIYAQGAVHIALPEVLALPRSAVLAPGRPYVFVDKGDGVFEQRKVKLGRAGDELWEILDGLSEGERVVTTGNLLIDSQAQLDASGLPHEHGPSTPETSMLPSPSSSLPALTGGQRDVATNFLALADSLTSALSDDNLEAFNQRAATLHSSSATLAGTLTNGGWSALTSNILAVAHLPQADNLKAARKAFHPLSLATVDLTKALQRHAGVESVRIFQCPMVKQAFPGAPRTGSWIQLKPQIRNPYFGAEMLDCGNEVKP